LPFDQLAHFAFLGDLDDRDRLFLDLAKALLGKPYPKAKGATLWMRIQNEGGLPFAVAGNLTAVASRQFGASQVPEMTEVVLVWSTERNAHFR
jgi:hypothetical protein